MSFSQTVEHYPIQILLRSHKAYTTPNKIELKYRPSKISDKIMAIFGTSPLTTEYPDLGKIFRIPSKLLSFQAKSPSSLVTFVSMSTKLYLSYASSPS